MRRFLWFIAVCILTSPHFSTADDAAELKAVVEKFFAAFAKKDLDGLMSLWDAKVRASDARRKHYQQMLTYYDHVRVENMTFSHWKIEGSQASVRLTYEMVSVVANTKQENKTIPIANLRFIKEDGVWKLSEWSNATDDLITALKVANTKEERARLLREEKNWSHQS